jgi:hypothetical protein
MGGCNFYTQKYKMTPRSLFNIILKVFGLFFVKEIIISFPQVASLFLLFSSQSTVAEGFIAIFFSGLVLLFFGLIAYQLLAKTNKWIDKFELDKGFDQTDFSLNFSTSSVLTIALFTTSGIILIDQIPQLCKLLYMFFEKKETGYFQSGYNTPDYWPILYTIIKIIIALLLIGERKRIVALIESKQKPKTEAEENK